MGLEQGQAMEEAVETDVRVAVENLGVRAVQEVTEKWEHWHQHRG